MKIIIILFLHIFYGFDPEQLNNHVRAQQSIFISAFASQTEKNIIVAEFSKEFSEAKFLGLAQTHYLGDRAEPDRFLFMTRGCTPISTSEIVWACNMKHGEKKETNHHRKHTN